MPLLAPHFSRPLVAGLSAVALAACEGGPRPGELEATLMSPKGPEGSAVFEIAALGLGPITLDAGQAFASETGDVTRVVVILDAPGQLTFRVAVDDVRTPPGIAVVQVADGDNNLQPSLSGYSVAFTR